MFEPDFIGTEAITGKIRVGKSRHRPGSPVAIAEVSDKTATIRLNVPKGSLSWHVPEKAVPSVRIAAPVESLFAVAEEGKKVEKKTLFRAPSADPSQSQTGTQTPLKAEEQEAAPPLTPRQRTTRDRTSKRLQKPRTEDRYGDTMELLDIDDGEFKEERPPIVVYRNWPLILCASVFCLLAGTLLGTFVVAPRLGSETAVAVENAEEDGDVIVAEEPPANREMETPKRAALRPKLPVPKPVPRIERLVLVDLRTGKDVIELKDGMNVNLRSKGPMYTIRAETVPRKVGCVSFSWNGTTCNLDRAKPYTIMGTKPDGKERPWYPDEGANRLLVVPYRDKGDAGITGDELRVSFTVSGVHGLIGTYYPTPDLTGDGQVRVDPKIDFDWGSQAPIRGIIGSGYSVRWQGLLTVPSNGTYEFSVIADGTVRLWIGKCVVIDGKERVRSYSGSVKLRGKHHHIRLEFLDVDARGVIQLSWRVRKKQGIIPASAFLPRFPTIAGKPGPGRR